MRSSKLFAVAVLSVVTGSAQAAQLNFSEPKRAVGREDNIRIDAQLNDDNLSSSVPVTVTYQVENLSKEPVAIADKIASVDYDPESNTLTLSIGAEVPTGDLMPHMVAIKPGEKRVLTGGSFAHIVTPSVRTPWTSFPKFIGIKVSVLRDLRAFASFIERQSSTQVQRFPNELFDRWVEGTDSVYLNPLPIRWKSDSIRPGSAESDRPLARGSGTF